MGGVKTISGPLDSCFLGWKLESFVMMDLKLIGTRWVSFGFAERTLSQDTGTTPKPTRRLLWTDGFGQGISLGSIKTNISSASLI